MKKYESTIILIGELVEEFKRQKMIILFDDKAPIELKEISVVHCDGELLKDVKPGDNLYIGQNNYVITAVGSVANKNLRDLGHICLKFNGRTTPDLPGDINLKTSKMPKIKIGDKIIIK